MSTNQVPSTREASEVWTVDRVLRWVINDFSSRGFDSPRLEAELLLCHALDCNRIQLIIDRDRPLTSEELATYRELVGRRRKREPVAYLRGEREFYGLRFRVDRRVLIPRPDTETLVEVALRRTDRNHMFGRMLDTCTGSGNVALSFGKERCTWQVIGTDLSAAALEVARLNAIRIGVAWNVSFAQGDLFEPVGQHPPFDLITANPPYIPTSQWEELEAGIKDYEPRLALDGGEDGLDIVRRLVADAPKHLVVDGVLALEIAWDQGRAVKDLFLDQGWKDVVVTQDLGRRDRVVSAVLGSK